MEPIYIAREKEGNLLSYVAFSNICNVIKSFPELKQKYWKIKYSFSSHIMSRAMEFQNERFI